DLRQRRYRQGPIAQRTADEQRDAQQRGRDRTTNERFRDVHGCVLMLANSDIQATVFGVTVATSLRCPTARSLAQVRFDPFDRPRPGCPPPSCRGARLEPPCFVRPCLERPCPARPCYPFCAARDRRSAPGRPCR